MEDKIDTHKQPIKISLQKSRNYNWEINVAGTDVDEILAVLEDADAKLRAKYLKEEEVA
jgi:hypothetical protein